MYCFTFLPVLYSLYLCSDPCRLDNQYLGGYVGGSRQLTDKGIVCKFIAKVCSRMYVRVFPCKKITAMEFL